MAASMWRMNEIWKGMAGVLLLCALLLSSEVMCQDDADADITTPGPVPDLGTADASGASGAPATTIAGAPETGTTNVPAGDDDLSNTPAAPGDHGSVTVTNVALDSLGQEGGTSGTTHVPSAGGNQETVAPIKDEPSTPKTMVPNVKCVGKEDIQESNAVKAVLGTNTCEETERVIKANPAVWCQTDDCNIEIFQDGNNALVASSNAALSTLSAALQSDHLKSQLGVTKTETPSSSGSSVFVGILVTGLLAAIAITVGYFKCQRRADTTKGVRLAEEAYPADQENQGNTLVSVAPLNPPPETQEKPSVNGESPEAAKTEPPPTNGHSTAKTADTEL